MKKLLLLVALAFSIMSTASVSIHADPPGPACPPFCDGTNGNGNGN